MSLLVQDVFTGRGGAERVFRTLAEEHFSHAVVGVWTGCHERIRTSHLTAVCSSVRSRSAIRGAILSDVGLLERVLEAFDRLGPLRPDLTMHHHFGLALTAARGSRCTYLHSPTRLLHEPHRVPWEVSEASTDVLALLREREDLALARTPVLAANSRQTSHRIERSMNVTPWTLYPPLERAWTSGPVPRRPRLPFLFTTTRLAASKSVESLLRIAALLPHRLVIATSDGARAAELQREFPGVEFRTHLPDRDVRELTGSAAACIATAEEDFGLFAAEALATGSPVVVRTGSGVLELCQGGGPTAEYVDPGADAGATLFAALDDVLGLSARQKEVELVREELSTTTFHRRVERLVSRSRR